MNAEIQKYLPGAVIAAIALFAIVRLKGAPRAPIVSNALLPSSQPANPPDSRDPARVASFGRLADIALGSQAQTVSLKNLETQFELGKYRLQEQGQVLQAGQSLQLELEKLRQAGASDRLLAQLADRNYDRQLQQRALDQSAALAQQGQMSGSLAQLLGALLGALKGGQSRSGGGGSGSGSGGGGAQPRPSGQRPITMWPCTVFGIPVPCEVSGSSPAALPDVRYDPGIFPEGYDPSASYNWFEWGASPLPWYTDTPEPIGSVSSSYDLFAPGFYSGDLYWSNFDPISGDWAGRSEIGGGLDIWDYWEDWF